MTSHSNNNIPTSSGEPLEDHFDSLLEDVLNNTNSGAAASTESSQQQTSASAGGDDFDSLLDDVLDSINNAKKQEVRERFSGADADDNDNDDDVDDISIDAEADDDDDDSVDVEISTEASRGLSRNSMRPFSSNAAAASRPAGAAPPNPFAMFNAANRSSNGSSQAPNPLMDMMSSMMGRKKQNANVPLTWREKVRKYLFLGAGLYFGLMYALFQYPVIEDGIINWLVNLHQSPWAGPFIVFLILELTYSFSDVLKLSRELLRIQSQTSNSSGGAGLGSMLGIGSMMKYMGVLMTGFKFLKAASRDIGMFVVVYVLCARTLLIVLQFLYSLQGVTQQQQHHVEL